LKDQTEEKRILKYKDIDAILEDISKAPEIPQEEKEIKSKKEILKALDKKKGILELLKKGYSIKGTMDFINDKIAPYSITEQDVKHYLPKVTVKKRKPQNKNTNDSSKTNKEDEKNTSATPHNQIEDSKGEPSENKLQVFTNVETKDGTESRLYLVASKEEKEELKSVATKIAEKTLTTGRWQDVLQFEGAPQNQWYLHERKIKFGDFNFEMFERWIPADIYVELQQQYRK
jgi:hypothetical protein